jgi:phage regulator Rha-like protein
MKSGFGDYWIGKFDEMKVDLPKKAKTFDDYDEALSAALDSNDSIENEEELESIEEDDVEELGENMLRWIVKE